MVCKRFRTRATTYQLDNIWVIDQIKQSMSRNENIQQVFVPVSHGLDIYFLWEHTDEPSLNDFLRSPETVMDDPQASPLWFSPHNLLSETLQLAQAVSFLHNQLYIGRGQRLTCSNMDLSLENIIGSLPPERLINQYPVGQWKITDFGRPALRTIASSKHLPMSVKKMKDSTKHTNEPNFETVFVHDEIPPQAFDAPKCGEWDEGLANPKVDVWAFGCILSTVLAFALGGSNEVDALHHL